MIEAHEDSEDEPGAGDPTLVMGHSEELTRALSAEGTEHSTVDPAQAGRDRPPTKAAQGTSDFDPQAWFLGRSFGGFRIVCALASGGMATVFLGRKEGPARVSKYAAVKIVHPHLAFEREFINMFLDEARIAALLDHPNVCRVLDFGVSEGTYYLAMEYVMGETWSSVRATLADHPDGARILSGITAHVLAQACEGLHAAHEAADEHGRPLHIVHRDISPQNIFVAYDGTVRVLDFGIARAADRITATRDGTLKGRLAYMSPEQMSGAPVEHRADIWSMGVVLREALEGKRLFRRSTDAETMLAVTHEPMPEWSVAAAPELRAIAERALSRDPNTRYQTAHEMAVDLARFAASARRPVGSSELSAWMGLLFAAQMEQKRALLQLSVPTPPSDGMPPWPSALVQEPPPEPNATKQAPSTIPARPRRQPLGSLRPRWMRVSALIALGSLGAIVGLALGRLGRREETNVVHEDPKVVWEEAPQPSVEPVPEIAPLPEAASIEAASSAPAPQLAAQAAQPRGEAPPSHSASQAEPPSNSRGEPTTPKDSAAPRTRRKEAPSETGAAQSGDTGTVLVAFAEGWAEVHLGPRLLGTTPGRFTLPAGKHTLLIRPFGAGKGVPKQVEVGPGATVKLFLGSSAP